MDEKQETENIFLINICGICFGETSNVIWNIPTEYINLFTSSYKYKKKALGMW